MVRMVLMRSAVPYTISFGVASPLTPLHCDGEEPSGMIEWTMRFRYSEYARCQEIRHQSQGGTRSVCGLKMGALRVGGRVLMGYCEDSIRNGSFGRIFTHRRQLSQLI